MSGYRRIPGRYWCRKDAEVTEFARCEEGVHGVLYFSIPQCEETAQVSGTNCTLRCYLDEGHEGVHRDQYTGAENLVVEWEVD